MGDCRRIHERKQDQNKVVRVHENEPSPNENYTNIFPLTGNGYDLLATLVEGGAAREVGLRGHVSSLDSPG
jgi:hypothetical protein